MGSSVTLLLAPASPHVIGEAMHVPVGDGVLDVGSLLLVVAAITVLTILATQATRSMNRRGAPGGIFGLLVVVCLPLGLLAWAIGASMRPVEHPRHVES